jgi:uncharacterized membrane protein
MSAPDPYAAPKSAVADAHTDAGPGEYIDDGQRVDAGAGWRWVADGWRIFRLQPGMWIGVSVVFMLLCGAASMVPFVGSIATMVATPVAFAGLLLGCRDLEAGGELTMEHLFAGFREKPGPLFALGALYLAAMMIVMLAVFLLAGGAFALSFLGGKPDDVVVVLVIALAVLVAMALSMPIVMAFWMATPLVLFHDLGPAQAIRSSFYGCLKNWLPFLVYGFVLVLLMIPATLPLFLGWLVLLPVLYASYYVSYRDIFTRPA